jgi:signal peptidase I
MAGRRSWVRELLETAVLTIAIFLVVRVALQNFKVEGESMYPNLHDSEYILVNKVDYYLHSPSRGDIIVFKPPIDTNIPYVKRVIGLPGDVVDVRDGRVIVNGRELNEPYAIGLTTARSGQIRFPFKVPAGSLFVLGDNRPVSGDSREWGAVPEENVIGKVIVKFWPLNESRFFDW